MKKQRRFFFTVIVFISLIILCVGIYIMIKNKQTKHTPNQGKNEDNNMSEQQVYDLNIDSFNWSYDEKNHVYYQKDVIYCEFPVSAVIENLSIYVPERYFIGNKLKNKKYACEINKDGIILDYSSYTAPIIVFVGGNKQSFEAYLKTGFVCVDVNYRYEADDLVSSIVDLKSAIRFLRYNKDYIPADSKKIFVVDKNNIEMLNVVLGVVGDSVLYDESLKTIGAKLTDKFGKYISDVPYGVECNVDSEMLEKEDNSYTDLNSPNLTNSKYFLKPDSRGFETSILAKNWLIISQQDSAKNLCDDLENTKRIDNLQIEEKSNDELIINWIKECTK